MNIINSNLTFKSLDNSNRKENIVLHHAEASTCSVQDVHSWHLNNGWSGIGYHYFVTKAGLVYTGRPVDAVGAHAIGYNSNSIGICAEGAFNKETMPQVQKQAIIDLCKYLINTYGIKKVLGHREVNATECPGTNYPLVEVKAAAFSIAPTPRPTIASTFSLVVRELQAAIRVLIDGIPGPVTLGACPLIGNGARGAVVKCLQKLLGISADGIFGPNTLKHVKQFQYNNGLTSDGLVGRNTWRKLLRL